MPTLRATVHVRDPETGVADVFLAGSQPPDWAVPFITNPDVWADSGPPPRYGRGSSTAAWRRYASEHGVAVSDTESKDAVMAALRVAGVPTGG